MTENSKRLTVFASVVHNASEVAVNLLEVLQTEIEKTDKAILMIGDGKLSSGHALAAIRYREYLWKVRAMMDAVTGIDTNYFLDNDYSFDLPEEGD